MFVPVWTSRQVRTAGCNIIVTARRRLSRNRFLSSSVCMSDLAWRRTAQTHQTIRSVGHKRIDQSEASGTSASTNQKRPQGTGQAFLSQSDSSDGHYSENLQDLMVRIVLANQITYTVIELLYHVHILRRIYKIRWSESYRPIRSFGQLLNRYIMVTFFGESTRSDGKNCIGQSYPLDSYLTVISLLHSSENLQDRMVRIVLANHITWTVIEPL